MSDNDGDRMAVWSLKTNMEEVKRLVDVDKITAFVSQVAKGVTEVDSDIKRVEQKLHNAWSSASVWKKSCNTDGAKRLEGRAGEE